MDLAIEWFLWRLFLKALLLQVSAQILKCVEVLNVVGVRIFKRGTPLGVLFVRWPNA